jgi:hypothetical protein
MSVICTQLMHDHHIPIDTMHRFPQQDTIKQGRVSYHERMRVDDAKGGLLVRVACDALRVGCGFDRIV